MPCEKSAANKTFYAAVAWPKLNVPNRIVSKICFITNQIYSFGRKTKSDNPVNFIFVSLRNLDGGTLFFRCSKSL